ncbi:hypothetical protein ACVG9K_000501 [Klebsiella oxytoca]
MTKSTITRELLEEWVAQFEEDGGCDATDRQLEALIRQSLEAMDSEPAAPVAEVVSIYGDHEAFGEREIRPLVGIQQMPYGTKLYRHAQQPVVDADDNFYSWFGREWQENYQHNQYTTAAKQMLGVMAESAWIAATERQRQKQSVSVPDVKIYEDVPYEVGRFKTHRDCYCDGWNACRAAMLQAGTLTNEDTRQVDELTMWIKRLVRSLKNDNPDSKLPREAMDYLTAKGLISVGGVLR